MRPLPELTPANEWFWTSGADGVLRIQGCSDCGELVHPPVPICPYCRSRSSKPTPVSGRGTIVGFTVNAHRWLPGLDPPYVIANVALEEDPRVHLTTNIVGCDPADVQIGQKVAVRFEQQEDVWLPLFELTGEIDPVDRVEEPVRPLPRAPLSEERFEHKAVLSGIGRSAFGRRLMVDPLSLAVDASLAAIADAGLTIEDIDGLSTYPGMSGGGMSEGGASADRRGPAHPPYVDQRRRRPPRSGWFGHCGCLGSRLRPLPPCPVLPDRVGVHLRRPDRASGAGRRGRRWRRRQETGGTGFGPVPRMASSLRRHVRRQLDRHERHAVHAPLWRSPRDAGTDRAQRAAERCAQPGCHLPGPDDDGRLPLGAAHHLPVRALRLRRTVRRVHRRHRLGGVGRRRPPAPGGAHRGGGHPDPRAGFVGPGHSDP